MEKKHNIGVKQYHIFTSRPNIVTYSVQTILDKWERGTIRINPEYQRKYVWDYKRAQLFILSLLERFPIPPIIAVERKDGTLEIIDGQQRLRTILWFFKRDKELLERYGSLTIPIKKFSEDFGITLKEAKNVLLKRKNRKADIDNLKRDIKNRILDLEIPFLTIREEDFNKPNIAFEIFQRINSGMVKQHPMEIRRVVFYNKDYYSLVENLANYELFQKIVNKDKQFVKRMKDQQAVLIFDGFIFGEIDTSGNWYGPDSFALKKQSLQSYLNFIAHNRKIIYDLKIPKLSTHSKLLEELWKNTIYNCWLVFGNNAFSVPYKEGNKIKFKRKVNEAIFLFEVLALVGYPSNIIN